MGSSNAVVFVVMSARITVARHDAPMLAWHQTLNGPQCLPIVIVYV